MALRLAGGGDPTGSVVAAAFGGRPLRRGSVVSTCPREARPGEAVANGRPRRAFCCPRRGAA